MKKANDRLKNLEKLEYFWMEKVWKEIEKLEEERRKDEEERDKWWKAEAQKWKFVA